MCCDSLLPWLAVLYVNVSCVVGSPKRFIDSLLRWRAQAYNTAYATRRTEDESLYFLVQPRVLGVPLISLGTAIGARVKFGWPRAVTGFKSRPKCSVYKPTAVMTAPAFPDPTSSASRLGLAVPQFATALLLMTTTTPSTRSADPHSDPRMTEAKQTRHEVQTQERLEAFSSPLPHHYMHKCETLSLPRGNTMNMICHRNLIRFKLRLPFTFFSLALSYIPADAAAQPERVRRCLFVCIYTYRPATHRHLSRGTSHALASHLMSSLLVCHHASKL